MKRLKKWSKPVIQKVEIQKTAGGILSKSNENWQHYQS